MGEPFDSRWQEFKGPFHITLAQQNIDPRISPFPIKDTARNILLTRHQTPGVTIRVNPFVYFHTGIGNIPHLLKVRVCHIVLCKIGKPRFHQIPSVLLGFSRIHQQPSQAQVIPKVTCSSLWVVRHSGIWWLSITNWDFARQRFNSVFC